MEKITKKPPFVKMPLGNIVPLGLSNGMLVYMDDVDEMKTRTYDGSLCSVSFMRPISKKDLESYQDEEHEYDYYKEEWKYAVSQDQTEDSLEDFISMTKSLEYDTDDKEWYCGRDMDELYTLRSCGKELRRMMDNYYAVNHQGEKPGSWEWHGCSQLEKPFDMVFNFPSYCEELERQAGFRD